MDLGDHLILGYSECKTGGRERLSVVSNAFEAVIGAMYMDGGLEPAKRFLEKFLFSHIDESCKKEDNINYKSWILEQSQRDGFGIPKYTVIGTTGPEHAKEFSVRIAIGGIPLGEGTGPNKKIAQQRAAYTASLNYNKETILSHIKGEREHELVSL
jgi:ribonuclease III